MKKKKLVMKWSTELPPEYQDLSQILSQPCIVDNDLLSNFVYTGQAKLLNRLLNQSVFLSPTILDPQELDKSKWRLNPPRSEFLKPLYTVYHGDYARKYENYLPHIEDFVKNEANLWKPTSVSLDELILANELSSKEIKTKLKEIIPELRGRVRVHPGEAETAAVAILRGWTFLGDDQAIITILRALYPRVSIIRTCQLISYAANNSFISCSEAQELFNERIAQKIFFASRNKNTEHLMVLCNPTRCEWVTTKPSSPRA